LSAAVFVRLSTSAHTIPRFTLERQIDWSLSLEFDSEATLRCKLLKHRKDFVVGVRDRIRNWLVTAA